MMAAEGPSRLNFKTTLLDTSLRMLNPFSDLFFTQSWRWPTSCQTSATSRGQSRPPETTSESRQGLIDWYSDSLVSGSFRGPLAFLLFTSLSQAERVASSAVYGSAFVEAFLKLLPNDSPQRLFHIPSGRKFTNPLPCTPSGLFETVLEGIRVGWTSEPLLYFVSEDTWGVVLQWLMSVSQGHAFEWGVRGWQLGENWRWFNCDSFHSLECWLASQIQSSIAASYHRQQTNRFQIEEIKDQIQSQKHCVLDIEKLSIKVQQFQQIKRQDLDLFRQQVREVQEKMRERRQQQLFLSFEADQQPAHKKKSKRRHKKKPAPNAVEQANTSAEEIVPEVKPSEAIVPQEITEVVQLQKQEPPITHDTVSPTPVVKASPADLGHSQRHSHSQTHSCKFRQSPSRNLIYVPPRRTRSKQHSPAKVIQWCPKYSQQGKENKEKQSQENPFSVQTSREQEQPQKVVKHHRKKKKENPVFAEARKAIWNKLISRELDGLVDELSLETNSLYSMKVLAFERVRVFVQSLYPNASPLLFGSNAIGLSLPDSDVDILLSGLPCNLREEASQILAHIAVEINAMGWIVSCATYLNAKVPVVKLVIDPSVSFLQTKRRQDLFRVYNPMALSWLDPTDVKPKCTISVDITINVQGISSVGYDSTLLMKDWIQKVPSLQRVLLLLKHILSMRSFNSNFNGGIGSYCLFTMVASYMHTNPTPDALTHQIFLRLIKWYGFDFKNEEQVIWLRQNEACYIDQADWDGRSEQWQGKKSPLRLIDPITGQRMNSSCHQYPAIRHNLRQIYEQLQSLQQNIDEDIRSGGLQANDLRTMLQCKKGVDKWVSRFEQRHGNLVRRILHKSY